MASSPKEPKCSCGSRSRNPGRNHVGTAALGYPVEQSSTWRLYLFIDHRISQCPHTLDADLDHVSTCHWADTLWSAGCNQVAGKESHDLRDIANDRIE